MTSSRRKVLPLAFFERPTLEVCRELLGKDLCRKIDGRIMRMPVTEVEAYDGFEDKASHAHKGATPRNAIMFGPAGYWYVYLCYGVHWMLNVVTGPPEYPAAVLFRGVGEVFGPGRLTRAMQIGKAENTLPCRKTSGLWLEDCGRDVPEQSVQRRPRVGINYAGSPWVEKPWRLVVPFEAMKKLG